MLHFVRLLSVAASSSTGGRERMRVWCCPAARGPMARGRASRAHAIAVLVVVVLTVCPHHFCLAAPRQGEKQAVAWLSQLGSLEVFDPQHNSVGGFRPLSGPLDRSRPTLALVHGWNLESAGSLNERGSWTFRALHSRSGDGTALGKLGCRDDLNVVAWNWLEAAKSRPAFGLPDNLVPLEGLLLAGALQRELGEGYDDPIHFIGHSLGAGVAVWAALALGEGCGLRVEQVTLCDAPELETTLERRVGRIIRIRPLRLEWPLRALTRAGVFVDNYPSAFGKVYACPRVANVDLEHSLTPAITELLKLPAHQVLPGLLQKIDDHGYALAWYFGWKSGEQYANGGPLWPRGSPAGTVVDHTPDEFAGYPFIAPDTPLETVGAAWSRVLAGNKGDSRRPASGGRWQMIGVLDPYTLIPGTVLGVHPR